MATNWLRRLLRFPVSVSGKVLALLRRRAALAFSLATTALLVGLLLIGLILLWDYIGPVDVRSWYRTSIEWIHKSLDGNKFVSFWIAMILVCVFSVFVVSAVICLPFFLPRLFRGVLRYLPNGQWRSSHLTFSLLTLLLSLSFAASAYSLFRDHGAWRLDYELPIAGKDALFSPTGRLIAGIDSSQENSTFVRVWEVANGRLAGKFQVSREVPFYHSADFCFSFLPTEESILCAFNNGLQLWNWRDGKSVRTWPNGHSVTISPDGQYFAAETPQGLQVFSIDQEEAVFDTELRCQGARLSHSGEYVLGIREDGRAFCWDVKRKRLLGGGWANKQYGEVGSYFSPDRNYLATASERVVTVLALPEFRPIFRVAGFHVNWSPRSNMVHVGGLKESVIADTSGAKLLALSDHFYFGAFMPDSRTFVGHKYEARQEIDVLDTATGKTLFAFRRPERKLNEGSSGDRTFCLSPTGDRLFALGSMWNRQRNEHWYGLLSVPSYWATVCFAALVVNRRAFRQWGQL